jgi:cytochrome c-type biogenesis protein
MAAATGVLVALGALAGLAIVVGRPVTQVLPVVEPAVGVALVVLGALVVTGRGPSWRVPLPARRADTPGFALFGVGYAGASAGCVLPIFLAVVVQAISLPVPVAAAVVTVYAAGVAVPLLAVTIAVGLGLDVAAGRIVGHGAGLERVAGAVLVLAGAGQILVAVAPDAVPSLPAIGDPTAPVVGGEVTQYYLTNAYKETQVKNAVTAVLAAYRGFDTLGEAVVVFSAGVVALSVLRREVFA